MRFYFVQKTMTIPTRDWLNFFKFGSMILAVFVLQIHPLLAEGLTPNATSTNISTRATAYTDYSSPEAQDILWLARVIYSETKIKEEQIVVAWVVRNRVETKYRGESTYKEVALDPSQFSGIKPAVKLDYSDTDMKIWQDSITIARAVYFADSSLRPVAQSVRHFYSPEVVVRDPNWAKNKKPAMVLRDSDGSVRFAFYDKIR